MSEQSDFQEAYERNPKHKSWLQPFDPDATLCPKWSHEIAQRLLSESLVGPADEPRFATRNGMAFAARTHRPGVWHGFPVPWSQVPETVREVMVAAEQVTRRQIKNLNSSDALAAELDDRS
jgi:hypothetical protein